MSILYTEYTTWCLLLNCYVSAVLRPVWGGKSHELLKFRFLPLDGSRQVEFN